MAQNAVILFGLPSRVPQSRMMEDGAEYLEYLLDLADRLLNGSREHGVDGD